MKHLFLFSLIPWIWASSPAQDPFQFCENIVTQGKASVELVPEIISFFVQVSVEDPDYETCAERALIKVDSLKTEFRDSRIDPELIKTLSYSISEIREHDRETGRGRLVGYRCIVPLIIKTQVDDRQTDVIFRILRTQLKAEIQINFQLSDDQMERVKERLLRLAVEDARSKAEILARNLDVRLGKVTKVQYGDPNQIQEFTRTNDDILTREYMTGSVRVPDITSLTPREIEMVANVMTAWEIAY